MAANDINRIIYLVMLGISLLGALVTFCLSAAEETPAPGDTGKPGDGENRDAVLPGSAPHTASRDHSGTDSADCGHDADADREDGGGGHGF